MSLLWNNACTITHFFQTKENKDNAKIQKLLYYAKGIYYTIYGDQLFEEQFVLTNNLPMVDVSQKTLAYDCPHFPNQIEDFLSYIHEEFEGYRSEDMETSNVYTLAALKLFFSKNPHTMSIIKKLKNKSKIALAKYEADRNTNRQL